MKPAAVGHVEERVAHELLDWGRAVQKDELVITIQTAMFVALGFLMAALIVLAVTPFYRRRAERLAVTALKRSMPISEAEIRADKDRVRAEYALLVHKLETKLEDANHSAARQLIERNRRDAAISALEGEAANAKSALEEHENARRVLEQTIMDRLPKVEHRLAEAKKLLFQRDREVTELSRTSDKQGRALEEATQINKQQSDDIHRLNAALTTRAARNREGLGDPRFDGEVALRSEIEALRAKTREQTTMISRLQSLSARAGSGDATADAGQDGEAAAGAAGILNAEAELNRLRRDLDEAQAALRAAQSTAERGEIGQAEKDKSLRAAQATNQDLTANVARLKALLQTYQTSDSDEKSIKESKIALKARLSALQALADEHNVTIQSLRAEVAAGNEKLARQAAHFMDEMRRLGAGTLPASSMMRRTGPEPVRRALSDRINDPRPVRSAEANGNAADAEAGAQSDARASGAPFLRSLGKGDAGKAGEAGEAASGEAAAATPSSDAPPRRPRLLERLSGVDKG